jgi:undecaprenyl diphosphate synthase
MISSAVVVEPTPSQIKHLAIIMDGNGRWAKRRSHQRVWGHIRGSSRVSEIVEEAAQIGLHALTLYTFSVENWSRPKKEIFTLFKLFGKFLQRERERILKNNISFKVIGDSSLLPEDIQELICKLEQDSANNNGMKLSLAFGYGGREEIVLACQRFVEANPNDKITPKVLNEYLMRPECGDVDLMIRTGGDQRISNFLLWQSAYAELVFTDTPWPEFGKSELNSILDQVNNRERRFGAVEATSDIGISHQKALENRSYFARLKSSESRRVDNE